MNKKVFITGENGCIARYIEKLLSLDFVWSYSHRDITKCSFNSTWNSGRELDICCYDLLKKEIERTKPDIIIHTAGFVDTSLCLSRPEESFVSNGYGSYNVAKICKNLGIKLVYLSTTAIFDPEDYDGNEINRFTRIMPKTIYGITKYTGEIVCKSLVNDLLIIRPCFVYGGSEDGHSSISRLIKSSIRNEHIDISLSKDYMKDFMRVEDLISAINLLLEKNMTGEFNISYGEPRYFKDIITIIEKVTNLKLNYTLFPELDYMKHHIVNNYDIKSLGWIPKISLEEGIKMSLSEIVKNEKK